MYLLATTILTSAALGGDLQIQSAESNLSINIANSITNSGNLTGDYDETSNPDGTITIPGVWGGSGNQEIPIEVSAGTSVSGSSLLLTFVIHLSSASSEPRAFNAGKEPTTPLLHWATHRSGLLTINKGAPKAGSLSFARSWAATVFMAIFVTVSVGRV